jgi:hypothetical protein
MAIIEYKSGTTFPGVIGRTIEQSSPAWPQPERAKEGAPNVLFIVLDDLGFGQLGCDGAPIHTPNLDTLADQLSDTLGSSVLVTLRMLPSLSGISSNP